MWIIFCSVFVFAMHKFNISFSRVGGDPGHPKCPAKVTKEGFELIVYGVLCLVKIQNNSFHDGLWAKVSFFAITLV